MQDKILRHLPFVENYNTQLEGTNKGIVVDIEATGPDNQVDTIIEFSGIPFLFTDKLEICDILPPVQFYNDPGTPIPPEVVKLTGITDDMVRGHSLDKSKIIELFNDVEIAIAHQAAFDRNILEKHVNIPEVVWGCTFKDIDYKTKGINSAALEFILMKLGFWYEGHQAVNDCRAVIHMLNYYGFFEELMENVFKPTSTVILRDTKFEENEIFRKFWFKWNREEKYWFKKLVNEEEANKIRTELLPHLSTFTASQIVEDKLKRFKI